MSRLLRPIAFSLAVLSLTLVGCRTSTPYTRMYSPRKSYYAAAPEKLDRTAEELLKAPEAANPGGPGGPPAAADPNAIPGLPPAAIPGTPPPAPADPLAPTAAPPAL